MAKEIEKKDTEMNNLKEFYEDKIKLNNENFANQKKLWSKIYTELLQEIS